MKIGNWINGLMDEMDKWMKFFEKRFLVSPDVPNKIASLGVLWNNPAGIIVVPGEHIEKLRVLRFFVFHVSRVM